MVDQPLIVAEGLTAGYELERERKMLTALTDISLTVNDGEFLILVGPSGCGKTTFINCIAGLVPIWGGTLTFDGKPVEGAGPDRAMVFQDYALLPWRTAYKNVRLPFELQPHSFTEAELHDQVMETLDVVGLAGFEQSLPYQLSGGMRQRVGIARALVRQPRVILADEPFGALDAMTREVLQAQLEQLTMERNQTVVFITHSIDEALSLGDRVAVISHRPGTVRTVIDVDIPRPRLGDGNHVKTGKRYGELRDELWNLVKDEALGAKTEAAL